jgi:hypothetical protein
MSLRPRPSLTSADALFNNLEYYRPRRKTRIYGRVPTGHPLDAENLVKELFEMVDRYVSPYHIVRVYGAINNTQRALEWLDQAYREHNSDLIELTREPFICRSAFQ